MRSYKIKQGERIYLMKTILSDWYGKVKGRPYRVLAIPEGFSLYRLAEAIVDSFGFYFDHPFGFYDNIKQWTKSKEGYELFADIGEESDFKGVGRIKINQVFNEIQKKMLFLFDYGDEWHFVVEFKGIESPKENEKYPSVLESIGDAPPQYGEPEEEF